MTDQAVARVVEPSQVDELVTLIAHRFSGRTSPAKIRELLESSVAKARERSVADDEIDGRLRAWAAQIDDKTKEFSTRKAALADVRLHLLHRPDEESLASMKRFAAWAIENWAVASAVLAVVSAAIVRIAYARYFDVFGLSPEDAGIDNTRMLIGSLPGVVLLVVVLSAVLSLLLTPWIAVTTAARARFTDRSRTQARSDVVWFVLSCAAVGSLVLAGIAYDFLDYFLTAVPVDAYADPAYLGAAFGAMGGVIGVPFMLALLAAVTAIRLRRRGVRPYVVIRPTAYLTAAVGVAPTILALVFVFLPLAAGARAIDVLDGHSVRSSTFLGVPVLGIRASVVTVEKSPIELPQDHCFILLGQGASDTTLFDVTGQKLYRFPKGEVAVSMTGASEDC